MTCKNVCLACLPSEIGLNAAQICYPEVDHGKDANPSWKIGMSSLLTPEGSFWEVWKETQILDEIQNKTFVFIPERPTGNTNVIP